MQTYFADLLAFFGISGAPQTFVELSLGCSVCWWLWVSSLPVFALSRNVLTLGGGFVDLHSCRCRLFSALAVSRRSLRSDTPFSLHLLWCQGWL